MLGSAVVWALSSVLMRPHLNRYSASQALTMSMPGALFVLIPYGWNAMLNTQYASITLSGWLLFAQIALLSGVIAFICFYRGVYQIGAGPATIYQFFVPPLAVFFSWWLMHTTLVPIQFAGMSILVLGVVIGARARSNAPAISSAATA